MIEVIFDEELKPWRRYRCQGIVLYFCGNIKFKGIHYKANAAVELLVDILKNAEESEYSNLLRNINGQYGVIIENTNWILCVADKIRSFPVYIYENAGKVMLTNNVAGLLIEKEVEENAIKEFMAAGYCLGEKTLFRNVLQLNAGKYYYYDKGVNKGITKTYYDDYIRKKKAAVEADIIDKLDVIINKSICNLIEISQNKTIILPLSGGLDSRLILAKLIEYNYKNIFCYTYGTKTLWELKVVNEIIEKTKIPWRFVEFNYDTKKMFHKPNRIEYYRKYSGYNSIPHLTDFYALQYLIEKDIIDIDKSIITNGQSGDLITGGHITPDIHSADIHSIIEYAIHKHFNLWQNVLEKEKSYYEKVLLEYMPAKEYATQELVDAYEEFEIKERQIKYVVNGQRAYDFFDLEWYLPFWSDEMIEYWSEIPYEQKINQKLYKDYLKEKNPAGLFNIKEMKKQNSLPYELLLLYYIMKYFTKPISKKFSNNIKRIYFSYFEKYYPYYPQLSYWQYIKDAKYHRQCVSYWVTSFLKENGLKCEYY